MKMYKIYLASEKDNSIHFRPTFYDKKTDDLSNLVHLTEDYVFDACIFDKKSRNMDFVEYGTVRIGFAVNEKAKRFLKGLNLPNYKTFPMTILYGDGNDESLFNEDYDRNKQYEYFVLIDEIIQYGANVSSSKDLYAEKNPNGFYQLYCSESFKSAYLREKLTGIIFSEVSVSIVNSVNSNEANDKTKNKHTDYGEKYDINKIVSMWLLKSIKQNHQFSSIKGIYFNILEMLDGSYGIHMYGTNSFDKDDAEWAIDEEVALQNNFCDLRNTIVDGVTWKEAIVILKETIKKVISQFEFISRSGIGFSDSEIEYFD